MLARLLARWLVKMRCFGTLLARWHVNHAGKQVRWHVNHVGKRAHMTRDLANSTAKLQYHTFGTLFLCKNENVSRFSDLHYCAFNDFFTISSKVRVDLFDLQT